MGDQDWLAQRFEEQRPRLRAVAYRMLGSLSDADDAVQEAWLRLDRAGADGVENLGAWLTTVVARVCLNVLRSRQSRREAPLGGGGTDAGVPAPGLDPEEEALLADSVGLALLVVLNRLAPAERLALVLHDMFDVPFDEIGSIVGRSPAAARQLASRARRRIQGAPPPPDADFDRRRGVVEAFLAAARAGDFRALLAVLDPEIVIRADLGEGAPTVFRGADAVARQAYAYARAARQSQLVLVEGAPGIVFAPGGRLTRVLRFTVRGDLIVEMEVVVQPARLQQLDLRVVPG